MSLTFIDTKHRYGSRPILKVWVLSLRIPMLHKKHTHQGWICEWIIITCFAVRCCIETCCNPERNDVIVGLLSYLNKLYNKGFRLLVVPQNWFWPWWPCLSTLSVFKRRSVWEVLEAMMPNNYTICYYGRTQTSCLYSWGLDFSVWAGMNQVL